jgi:hypothetical protein
MVHGPDTVFCSGRRLENSAPIGQYWVPATANHFYMNDEVSYRAFGRAVQAAIDRLLDSIGEDHATEDHTIPENWGATQVLLKNVAEDLMVCTDWDSAVAAMHDNVPTLWVLVFLATEIEDEDYLRILQAAFKSRADRAEPLPGQAYAAFLMEMARCEPPCRRNGVVRLFRC